MEHSSDLAERIGELLFDEESSDVTIIVEGESVPAHRSILITSGEHFRTLFQGSMKESFKDEIVLKDVSLSPFKKVMGYIYAGFLDLGELETDTILEVLDIAHRYKIAKLESTICQHLQKTLSIDNVCAIFSKAYTIMARNLYWDCRRLMQREAHAVLLSGKFCDLSQELFSGILDDDYLCADEIDIFKAAVLWYEKHKTQESSSDVFKAIRLPLIDMKNLLTTVKDSGLFTPDSLLDALRTKECNAANLDFRGRAIRGTNFAKQHEKAERLFAINREKCVKTGTCPDYKREPMPRSPSEFGFPAESCLTIALHKPFWVDYILFRFCDNVFTCSYHVEVSVDLIHWARIIDHSAYNCRAYQFLSFKKRVVRYIRLSITEQGTGAEVIKLSHFCALFESAQTGKLHNGFYVADFDVASAKWGTTVVESLDGSNALIEDETVPDEKGKSKWTSHEIGKGSIVIHLTQPFAVNSMRMLLRDDESRAYLYYVETSIDKKTWTRVADHTTHLCRSWQNIEFELRPVLFIRIVGTASVVDEHFSCAHFACPAPKPAVADSPAPQSAAEAGAATHA